MVIMLRPLYNFSMITHGVPVDRVHVFMSSRFTPCITLIYILLCFNGLSYVYDSLRARPSHVKCKGLACQTMSMVMLLLSIPSSYTCMHRGIVPKLLLINPLRMRSRVTLVCLSVCVCVCYRSNCSSVDPCCPSVVLTESARYFQGF